MSRSRCVHLLGRFSVDVHSKVHTNVHIPREGVARPCIVGSSWAVAQSRPGRRSRGVRRVGRRALTARTDSRGHNGSGRPVRAGLDASRPLPVRRQSPGNESGGLTGWLRTAVQVCGEFQGAPEMKTRASEERQPWSAGTPYERMKVTETAVKTRPVHVQEPRALRGRLNELTESQPRPTHWAQRCVCIPNGSGSARASCGCTCVVQVL